MIILHGVSEVAQENLRGINPKKISEVIFWWNITETEPNSSADQDKIKNWASYWLNWVGHIRANTALEKGQDNRRKGYLVCGVTMSLHGNHQATHSSLVKRHNENNTVWWLLFHNLAQTSCSVVDLLRLQRQGSVPLQCLDTKRTHSTVKLWPVLRGRTVPCCWLWSSQGTQSVGTWGQTERTF